MTVVSTSIEECKAARAAATGKVRAFGRTVRRFAKAGARDDGTPRWLACGQIDEAPWHEPRLCFGMISQAPTLARAGAGEGAAGEREDTFRGDDRTLVASIDALLALPDSALSHRLPGLAKQLLASAASRLLAHPSTPPAADAVVEHYHARQIAEVMDEGDGFWKPCSGCQEGIDGYVSQTDYPFNRVFRCQPGGGCGECGGLGVLWDDTDYDAMTKAMLADMEADGDDAPPAADEDRVRSALTDLVTWFDKPVQGDRGMVWVIRAGDQGADDAVAEALAALKSSGAKEVSA